MTPHEIKQELKTHGSSMAAIARETGCWVNSVQHVINNGGGSKKNIAGYCSVIRQRIPEVIEKSFHDVWPKFKK